MGIIDPGDTGQIFCPHIDWSAAAGATSYSQLAGVLAGFAFAGLVLLLSQQGSGTLRARAMSMLIAAFVLLSMDSFNFGFITGNGQAISEETATEVCSRTWTQFMFAGGMLGVGGVAVVSAACWLLAAHVEADRLARAGCDSDDSGDGSRPGPADFTGVQRLARAATYCVAGVTVLLLFVTARSYLDMMRELTSRSIPTWILFLYPIAILSGIVLLRVRARARARLSRSVPPSGGVQRSSDLAFTVGVYGAIAYATVGTAVVGLAADLPAAVWESASEDLAIVTAALCLLLPAPTLIALVHTAPRFQSEAPRDPQRPGPRSSGPERPGPPEPPGPPALPGPPAPPGPPGPSASPSPPPPSRPRKATRRSPETTGRPQKTTGRPQETTGRKQAPRRGNPAKPA